MAPKQPEDTAPQYYAEIYTAKDEEKKRPGPPPARPDIPPAAIPPYHPQPAYYNTPFYGPGAPARPGSMPPPPPHHMITPMQQQPGPVYMVPNRLGFKPQPISCGHCGAANVQSKVKYENGVFTWLSAGFLCFLGCWCGCCCIPLAMDDFKDAEHYCPGCGKMVGERARLS